MNMFKLVVSLVFLSNAITYAYPTGSSAEEDKLRQLKIGLRVLKDYLPSTRSPIARSLAPWDNITIESTATNHYHLLVNEMTSQITKHIDKYMRENKLTAIHKQTIPMLNTANKMISILKAYKELSGINDCNWIKLNNINGLTKNCT